MNYNFIPIQSILCTLFPSPFFLPLLPETPKAHVFKADLPGSKEEVKLEVKIDKIKEAMENGVLIVTVPKEEIKKTAIKSTEISG